MTADQILQQYNASMDSVDLINDGQPQGMLDEDWAGMLTRNKEHLIIMIAKDYWTNEDLKPFNAAISRKFDYI